MRQNKVLPPPERKAAFVRELFVRIAGRYDLMNRVMTFGRDGAWRRITVARTVALARDRRVPRRPLRVLDVATGTGDLALEMIRLEPDVQIAGLDFVPEMLYRARQKAAAVRDQVPGRGRSDGLSWIEGDALRLPFCDGCFDVVVSGFAMRNVTDIPATFAEMARVTRPGGRVACLEIARPQRSLALRLFRIYFYRLVPLLGGLITGERLAYTYLPHSVTHFLTPDEIADVMQRAGWQDLEVQRLMLGMVALHTGRRA